MDVESNPQRVIRRQLPVHGLPRPHSPDWYSTSFHITASFLASDGLIQKRVGPSQLDSLTRWCSRKSESIKTKYFCVYQSHKGKRIHEARSSTTQLWGSCFFLRLWSDAYLPLDLVGWFCQNNLLKHNSFCHSYHFVFVSFVILKLSLSFSFSLALPSLTYLLSFPSVKMYIYIRSENLPFPQSSV